MPAVGATAGTLLLRTDDGTALELIGARGYSEAVRSACQRIPLDAASPAADVVRSRRPLWLGSLTAEAAQFSSYLARPTGHQAAAVLPLAIDLAVSGALTLSFSKERAFDPEERTFLLTVAGQCATALQRAAAYEEERRVRERLEDALEAGQMGTWDWDLRTNEVVCSPQLEVIHGQVPGSSGQTFEARLADVHPDDAERVRAAFLASIVEGEHQLEYRIVWPDGSVHWVEARGRVVRDESGAPIAMRGLCTDITARKEAEQERERSLARERSAREAAEAVGRRLEMQYQVAALLSKTTVVHARVVLETVCTGLGWNWGALWRVDAGVLRCDAVYRSSDGPLAAFEAHNRDLHIRPGAGLLGRVWQSGAPLWVDDVGQDPDFLLGESARQAGLRSAVALPIHVSGELVGVLEFLRCDAQPHDAEMLNTLFAVGGQLGQFLERRRAEETLSESEAQKRAILESAIDAIITVDHEGRIRDFNPAAERMFGHARAEAVGRDVAQLIIPPRFRESHSRGFAHFLETGDERGLHTRLDLVALRADGTEFPIEITVTRIPSCDPPICTGFIRDISDRRWMEQRSALRYTVTHVLASAENVREAIQAILEAVCETLDWQVGELWLVDREANALRLFETWGVRARNIRAFMRARSEALLLPGAGVPGRVWASGEAQWMPDIPVDSPSVRLAMKAGLRASFGVPVRLGGEVFGAMVFAAGRTQEPDPALLELMTASGGQIGQFLRHKWAEEDLAALLGREQTARAEAEAAMAARDEFASVVSHDLRNPLTAIMGEAQLLQRRAARGDAFDLDPVLAGLRTIEGNAARMTALISELLDAVKLRSGQRLELQPRLTDLAALTKRAIAVHQGATKRHRLIFEGTEPGPSGEWDPERLDRVLGNLLSNAIKYSPQGGEILLRVERDETHAVLSVQDHGVGIPATDLPHVFDRYFRARNVTGAFAGSGLGLTGAKYLVEQHGGTIAATSVEGDGTRFEVRLPLSRSARAVASVGPARA
jgi:PAS domain S-box-containing protein